MNRYPTIQLHFGEPYNNSHCVTWDWKTFQHQKFGFHLPKFFTGNTRKNRWCMFFNPSYWPPIYSCLSYFDLLVNYLFLFICKLFFNCWAKSFAFISIFFPSFFPFSFSLLRGNTRGITFPWYKFCGLVPWLTLIIFYVKWPQESQLANSRRLIFNYLQMNVKLNSVNLQSTWIQKVMLGEKFHSYLLIRSKLLALENFSSIKMHLRRLLDCWKNELVKLAPYRDSYINVFSI